MISLVEDSTNWNLISYHRLKVARNMISIFLWVYFYMKLELRSLWMH